MIARSPGNMWHKANISMRLLGIHFLNKYKWILYPAPIANSIQ